jgi:DNA-binding MarR family transcriptional regulator
MDRVEIATKQIHQEIPGADWSPIVLSGRLTMAAQIITRETLKELVTTYDIRSGQFDLLTSLFRSGMPYTLTVSTLIKDAFHPGGSMTRRIDSLEKRGLVARAPHPNDRRGILVGLTKEGLCLVTSAIKTQLKLQESELAVLTPPEQEQLENLLNKLIAKQKTNPTL